MNNIMMLLNGQAGIAVAALLLLLLAIRELARVSAGPRWRSVTRALTIATTPLLIVFVVTVVVLIVGSIK